VLDAPREVRRERVLQRNAEQGETFSMVVPLHIFELASDLWQPPDAAECAQRSVVFVKAGEW
ncbi:MAG: ATP-binding protein, partial [Comamonadaceae bacterium]